MAKYIEIDYSGVFKHMKERNISQNTLIKEYGFTSRMFMAMKNGGNVQTDTIIKLARILHVYDISELIQFKEI